MWSAIHSTTIELSRKMRILIVMILSALAWSGTANAKPSEWIQYLMDEPVTMFDRGMDELDDYSNTTIKSALLTNSQITEVNMAVAYDSQQNRITIDVTNLFGNTDIVLCATIFKITQEQLGYKSSVMAAIENVFGKSEEYKNVGTTLIKSFFVHHKSSNRNVTEKETKEINRRITEEIIDNLSISVTGSYKDNFGIRCHGLLTATGPSY